MAKLTASASIWLIVRQALVLAKFDDIYAQIDKYTYAIVFFGPPHRGTNEESLGTIAGRIARNSKWRLGRESTAAERSLIDSLTTDRLFAEDFTELLNECLTDYRVVNLCETIPSLNMGVVGSSSQVMEMSADPR